MGLIPNYLLCFQYYLRQSIRVFAAGSGVKRLTSSPALNCFGEITNDLGGVEAFGSNQFLRYNQRTMRLAIHVRTDNAEVVVKLLLEFEGDIFDSINVSMKNLIPNATHRKTECLGDVVPV
jgi:hypothetical protein